MNAIHAWDFNGNLTDQSYQLETREEKIKRLKQLGYKSVWFENEESGESERIELNSADNKILFRVDFSFVSTVKEYGKTKTKHGVNHIFVFADKADDISARIDILKIFAPKRATDFIISSCDIVKELEKNAPCLVINHPN